jgi:hypothetical protein
VAFSISTKFGRVDTDFMLTDTSPPDPLSVKRRGGARLCLKRRSNQIESSRQIAADKIVGDPYEANSAGLNDALTIGIELGGVPMNRAVNLNNEPL